MKIMFLSNQIMYQLYNKEYYIRNTFLLALNNKDTHKKTIKSVVYKLNCKGCDFFCIGNTSGIFEIGIKEHTRLTLVVSRIYQSCHGDEPYFWLK